MKLRLPLRYSVMSWAVTCAAAALVMLLPGHWPLLGAVIFLVGQFDIYLFMRLLESKGKWR